MKTGLQQKIFTMTRLTRNIRNDEAHLVCSKKYSRWQGLHEPHKNFLHSNLRCFTALDSKRLMTYLGVKVESLENIDGVWILSDIVIHYLVHPIQECWSLYDGFKVWEIKALQWNWKNFNYKLCKGDTEHENFPNPGCICCNATKGCRFLS